MLQAWSRGQTRALPLLLPTAALHARNSGRGAGRAPRLLLLHPPCPLATDTPLLVLVVVVLAPSAASECAPIARGLRPLPLPPPLLLCKARVLGWRVRGARD